MKQSTTSDPNRAAAEPATGRGRGESRPDIGGAHKGGLRVGEYVLVVDDEPAVRHLLDSQLDYLGYAHRTARSAEQALDTLRRHHGALLVLSDVQMPGVGGVELLNELRRIDPDIQVIMV
ncbi:MAG: response regulator, partial [Thermoanaerobaculia bacterium]